MTILRMYVHVSHFVRNIQLMWYRNKAIKKDLIFLSFHQCYFLVGLHLFKSANRMVNVRQADGMAGKIFSLHFPQDLKIIANWYLVRNFNIEFHILGCDFRSEWWMSVGQTGIVLGHGFVKLMYFPNDQLSKFLCFSWMLDFLKSASNIC